MRSVVERFPKDCLLTVDQEAVRSRVCPLSSVEPQKAVLGTKVFAPQVLVRGPDFKVYVFKDDKLAYIHSLEELNRDHAGERIFNVGQDVIDDYLGRSQKRQVAGKKEYADGQLIRGSDMKDYFLTAGRRHHVLNLEELRTHHFGQEIFNVSDEVVAGYESLD